jgi:hypothetical protein
MEQAALEGKTEGTFSGTTLNANKFDREGEVVVAELEAGSLLLAVPVSKDKGAAAPEIF